MIVGSAATGLAVGADVGGSIAIPDPCGQVAANVATDTPTMKTLLVASPAAYRRSRRPDDRSTRPLTAGSGVAVDAASADPPGTTVAVTVERGLSLRLTATEASCSWPRAFLLPAPLAGAMPGPVRAGSVAGGMTTRRGAVVGKLNGTQVRQAPPVRFQQSGQHAEEHLGHSRKASGAFRNASRSRPHSSQNTIAVSATARSAGMRPDRRPGTNRQ